MATAIKATFEKNKFKKIRTSEQLSYKFCVEETSEKNGSSRCLSRRLRRLPRVSEAL